MAEIRIAQMADESIVLRNSKHYVDDFLVETHKMYLNEVSTMPGTSVGAMLDMVERVQKDTLKSAGIPYVEDQ